MAACWDQVVAACEQVVTEWLDSGNQVEDREQGASVESQIDSILEDVKAELLLIQKAAR